MKKLKSLLLFTFIIVSISSCGYQLRGSINIEGLENVNILSDNKNNIIGSVKPSKIIQTVFGSGKNK